MSSSAPGNDARSERQVFDPDSIRTALLADLPSGMRALANAIDAGDIGGRLIACAGIGIGYNWRDTRMHIHVTLDVNAEVFRWRAGEKVLLERQPTLALPGGSELDGVSEPRAPKYSATTHLIIGALVTFFMGCGVVLGFEVGRWLR